MEAACQAHHAGVAGISLEPRAEDCKAVTSAPDPIKIKEIAIRQLKPLPVEKRQGTTAEKHRQHCLEMAVPQIPRGPEVGFDDGHSATLNMESGRVSAKKRGFTHNEQAPVIRKLAMPLLET